jgi:hypothetical protein
MSGSKLLKPNDLSVIHLSISVYDDGGKVIAVASCFEDQYEFFQYGPRVRHVMPLLQSGLIFDQQLGFCQNHVLLCFSPCCSGSKILLGPNPEKN